MADDDDDEGPHDYECIDEFLYSKEECNRPYLERAYSEEARSQYNYRPSSLPRGVSVDSSDSMSATQFAISLPRSLPHHQNVPVYQPKVPICISEPSTPVASQNRPQTILRSPAVFQDAQIPPPIRRDNKPPPRPPKPSKFVEPQRKEPKVISTKPYSLSDFCAYETLPKLVRVHAGYYGETEKTSISEGEEFSFYLLKTVQAIPAKPVRSSASSEKFHIPCNSMLKIAVIDKHSESIKNFVYSSLSDLMANRMECPRVVCVTKDHFVQSELLPTGTLLFLDEKPTKKSTMPEEPRSYFIRCKTRQNNVYELPMDSTCCLTTHPADTQIYIREYQHMVNKFPVDVQLFRGDSDDIYQEPSEVTSSIGMNLTLYAPIKQKSIIAKTDLEGTRKDNPITVEIPFDLPIEVEAIEREEVDMEKIYTEVMDLYENFNPDTVERSYGVYDSAINQLYHEYETADVDYTLECPHTDYEPLEKVLKAREQQLACIASSKEEDDIDKLKEQNRKLQEEIEMLRQKKSNNNIKAPNGDYSSMPCAENVQELKSMDVMGISQLLQNMGLPQYVEVFRKEHMDGELFAELTESDLTDMVKSPLHRKRLMLIVTGQTSIRKYFDAENPYGTMVRKE